MKLIRSKEKKRVTGGIAKGEKVGQSSDKMASKAKIQFSVSSLDCKNWRMLIVDDEPDIHEITRIALKGFTFEGKNLELVNAYSAKEAREILEKDQNFAAAIIDVVMETEEAGLELVRYIRETQGLSHIRLIVRTGQPGKAPEKFVIDNYDIDDYKEKTDMTALKMYTMSRNSIKSFNDIITIAKHKEELEEKVLDRTHELRQANKSLQQENEIKQKLIVELQEANNQVKTLSGIIPICMHCKEIRDDKGFWNRLEKFIEDHSDAHFSHSICDKCLDERISRR